MNSNNMQVQLKKIHPLDISLEVFLADLTARPAKIIKMEMAGFANYAGTGTFDIEPPFTVRHLMMFSRSEIRSWPNFGKKCLNEVEEMLRAIGLQLWENHDERSLRLLREHKLYFPPPVNQTELAYHEATIKVLREALLAVANNMTVGFRYTNEGQGVLDALTLPVSNEHLREFGMEVANRMLQEGWDGKAVATERIVNEIIGSVMR